MIHTITVPADKVLEGDLIQHGIMTLRVERISTSPVDAETLHFHCNDETYMTSALLWEPITVILTAR